ncbi:MAG: PKD domain-containing protein [Methanomicrobiales archaeon]|nr:PKD domain-containing protein [Methanomicrobiales archaeon]
MFSSSSHKRIMGHDKKRRGFITILATLLVILSLFLPAALAENASGTFSNGTNTLPAVTSLPPTTRLPIQQVAQNIPPVTTAPVVVATLAVKAPKIEFTVTPTDGIAPHTVTIYPIFNASGGAPQFIVLDFGDGQQSNDTLKTSYEHTYPIAGNYTITLTSVNAGGSNVETLQSPVSVRIPIAVTSALPTVIPTTAPNATLTVLVTPVITTAPVQNATVVNATMPAVVMGATQNASANNSPCFYPNITKADITATPIEGPAPLRVMFSDNSSCAPPVAWQWDFGSPVNPGITTMRDPVMTYAEPGTYNVTLLVINAYNNNSTKTLNGFIHVLPPVTPVPYPVATPVPVPTPVPVIVPNFAANLTTGPAPLCVQFTESSTGTAAITWSWDFGDGTNATVKDPVHCYQKTGNYSVALKTAPSGGAPATKVKESYIVVSSVSAPFPMDVVFVIGIIIVIIIVVGLFVMKRKGGSHQAHMGSHPDESMKSEPESEQSRPPRRGRDL